MQNLMDRRALSSRLAQQPNESPFPQFRFGGAGRSQSMRQQKCNEALTQ